MPTRLGVKSVREPILCVQKPDTDSANHCIDFFLDYEEFKEWRDMTEDSMTWDLIEFWETWHDVNCDGIIKELSAKEKLAYNKAKNKLLAEHEKKRADIESEAVKIGL